MAAPTRLRSKMPSFLREQVVGLLGDDHQIAARPQVVDRRRDDDGRVAQQRLLEDPVGVVLGAAAGLHAGPAGVAGQHLVVHRPDDLGLAALLLRGHEGGLEQVLAVAVLAAAREADDLLGHCFAPVLSGMLLDVLVTDAGLGPLHGQVGERVVSGVGDDPVQEGPVPCPAIAPRRSEPPRSPPWP